MCIILLPERAERAGECDRGANRDTLGLGISQGDLPTANALGGFRQRILIRFGTSYRVGLTRYLSRTTSRHGGEMCDPARVRRRGLAQLPWQGMRAVGVEREGRGRKEGERGKGGRRGEGGGRGGRDAEARSGHRGEGLERWEGGREAAWGTRNRGLFTDDN